MDYSPNQALLSFLNLTTMPERAQAQRQGNALPASNSDNFFQQNKTILAIVQ